MDDAITVGQVAHGHSHEHEHEELAFWRKYIFSVDHKVIGIQYALTGLLFLLFGFTLMMIMRFQLAYPGHPIPLIGSWFGPDKAPGGIMLPEFYNQLGAMHGTIMVFLGVVPLAVGGFGNFVMPLQIGAPDMAFPKINMMSYWVYFLGGVVMLSSFFVPGGAAQSGWTSYPPLSDHRHDGADDVADRHGVPDHLLAARLGQLHRHDRAAAGQGPELHAHAVLRLGAVRDRVPAAAGVPSARGGRRPAVDGPPRRDELLPAERPRTSGGKVAARSPAAAIRCCGSICSGSSPIPRCTS